MGDAPYFRRFHSQLPRGAHSRCGAIQVQALSGEGGGYPNFTLSAAADYDYLGSIFPSLGSDWVWNLDNPGDTVATVYRLEGRKFRVEFRFPEGLEGDPSDYVVIVWGFRGFSRPPSIGDKVDMLGYARIRVE